MGGPFTVRAWPADGAKGPQDNPGWETLAVAIAQAESLARNPQFRTVMVIDEVERVWAQFNGLWTAPAEVSGYPGARACDLGHALAANGGHVLTAQAEEHAFI